MAGVIIPSNALTGSLDIGEGRSKHTEEQVKDVPMGTERETVKISCKRCGRKGTASRWEKDNAIPFAFGFDHPSEGFRETIGRGIVCEKCDLAVSYHE